MALRWLFHSACNIVMGQPKEKEEVEEHKTLKGLTSCSKSYSEFQMPLHYPRYTKSDYEKMEEWKVDLLLQQYGLSYKGTLDQKRAYAMGAFLWPHQYD